MRIQCRILGLAVVMTFSTCSGVQSQMASTATHVTVLESPRATGKVDAAKVELSLRLAFREISSEARPFPNVLVLHLDKHDAQALGVQLNSVWRNDRGKEVLYEIWLLEAPTNRLYSGLAEVLAERYLECPLDSSERERVVRSVKARLEALVSVDEVARNQ
jgi:hypothetical protein